MPKVLLEQMPFIEELHERHVTNDVACCDVHKWPHECDFIRNSLGIHEDYHAIMHSMIELCGMEGFKALMNNVLTLFVKRASDIHSGGKFVSINTRTGETFEPVFASEKFC